MIERPQSIEAAKAIVARAAEMRAKAKEQLFSRQEKQLSETEWDFFKNLTHARQYALLRSRSQFKALLTCRRWGKTSYGLFETLLHARRFPKSTIFYIVPDSKGHARRLFWRPLLHMDKQLKLNLTFHETDKRVTTPEGTDILLFGAHDKDASVQLRGDQSGLSLAILDECKDFGAHFEDVVTEAVIPALRDWGGTLVLQGTPGSILSGLFYEVTRRDSVLEREGNWEVVRGRIWDNTFLAKDDQDEEMVWRKYYRRVGVAMDSPKFLREVKGEWITDDTERAYAYDPARNHYAFDGKGIFGLPLSVNGDHHEWQFCIGIDLGESDDNAFVVYAFSLSCREIFVIDCYARKAMSIAELAGKYQELERKYGGFTFAVADTGGYGRGIVTELQNRYNLPLEAAEKGRDKLGTVALMNSDFISGRIKANKDGAVAQEWVKLTRKLHPVTLKTTLEHSDYGDAALYAWKHSLHWVAEDIPLRALTNSREAWLQNEQTDISKAVERRNDRNKAPSERNG